jgi:hypothetical protein
MIPHVDIYDTYSEVQRRKDRPIWEGEGPSREMIEKISATFRAQVGREIASAELKTTLDGMGWLMRMAAEEDVPLEALMQIAEDIESKARANIARTSIGVHDQLSVGVGAGFFTGLWVGILFERER